MRFKEEIFINVVKSLGMILNKLMIPGFI